MYTVMKKYMSSFSTLQGSQNEVDREALRRIFNEIDRDGDGEVTLPEYKETLESNPELFKWYSIFNNRITY